jgi:hypothetical protein
VEKHAHFHKCAAEVVRKVESGDKDGARLALRDLAGVSRETVAAIMELRKDAAKL